MKEIFALDVGTRNVVGILAKSINDKIIVEDLKIEEHETRAMEDGQIHDIEKVTKTVLKVKKELEEKNNIQLKDVAVAVAGRALVTKKGIAKEEIDPENEITKDIMQTVELESIQNSLLNLESQEDEYHCVGYTVVKYKLDGQEIKNPLYQKGETLEVEILATFLPKIVVDSMYTMAKKADLNIINLTLEPIAAINVVIPADMRKLNLALVDIGAGTSDIAITADGKIVGYEMVPMAGDEITEVISEEYLLEFKEAEKIKRKLSKDVEYIEYTDVLGLKNKLEKDEILKVIEDKVEELAEKIVTKILEVNGKATKAIILIGGGSQTVNLSQKIANRISLSSARVAVRGTESIKNLEDRTGVMKTSEYVTPVGIANMGMNEKGFHIINVIINKKTNRIFSVEDKVTVMDALLSSGIDSKKLYSKPGNPLTLKVNSKLKVIKGEPGKPALIKVNGEHKDLEYKISSGAKIDLKYPRQGRDAVYKLGDLSEEIGKMKIMVDDKPHEIKRDIKINNKIKTKDYIFKDRDEITFKEKYTVLDILNKLGRKNKIINFKIDGKSKHIEIPVISVYRNGEKLQNNIIINDGDKLTIKKDLSKKFKIKDILDETVGQKVIVTVNSKKVDLGTVSSSFYKNETKLMQNYEIKDGDELVFKTAKENLPIVSDIFKEHDLDYFVENKKKGGMLKLELNGKKAEYIDKIRNGDVLKIYYD
ncbi:MAG: pilus assembly protein PilM [Fusobacteriota bacterium]